MFLSQQFFCVQGSIHALFLYDAVYLFMAMMDQIVSEKLCWRNGTFWLNMARNWVTYGEWIRQLVDVSIHTVQPIYIALTTRQHTGTHRFNGTFPR